MWGDTDLIPRGIGTFGSRSAATGGSAVVDASRNCKAKLLSGATETLGIDAKLLDMQRGAFVKISQPSKMLATVGEDP